MSGWFKLTLRVGIFAVGISAASCFAAGSLLSVNTEEDTHEKSWNREHRDDSKQDARAIVKKKAMARAEQRNDRLASSAWYGISNSRPSGSATPFTSRYGSQWEMPGGRPYSWYPAYTQPNYVFMWGWW